MHFNFVLQLAFRSVSSSIQNKREQVRRILQLPPPSPATAVAGGGTSGSSGSNENDEEAEREMVEVVGMGGSITTKSKLLDGDTDSLASVNFSTASTEPAAAKDLEDAITAYLRRATENFDLSKNVEVCITNLIIAQPYIYIYIYICTYRHNCSK